MNENVITGPGKYPRKAITNGLDALTRLAAYLYGVIQKNPPAKISSTI
jgi:hypothetical protein